MWGVRTYFFGLLALLCWVAAPAAAQRSCVSPGSILEIQRPEFLTRETPNLFLSLPPSRTTIRVRTISVTESRLRVQMPSVGLVPNGKIRLRHIGPSNRERTLTTLRTCNFTTPGPGGPGSENAGPSAQPAPAQAATRFEVAAPSGTPEVVIMGGAGQVSRAEALVQQAGGSVLRRRSLPNLGLGMAMVDLRGALTLTTLRSTLSRRNVNVASGPHHVYRLAQRSESNAFAREMTLGSAQARCQLRKPVRIGLIDGPVNTRHPALRSVRIETSSVLGRRDRPASSDHATGISGLIAAQQFGLAQGAQILSVTAVHRVGTREIAKLENIAAALDQLAARKVDIINMSLAGPSNAALERAIARTARRGIVMVASVGNNRRSPVAYPASDPNVIAVTAIDADKRLYRHASRGSNVDFAAPGVDLRVPKGRSGSAFRSGTSYASAALTAIIAIEMSRSGGSPSAIRRSLSARAEDLGSAGPDANFGFGLAQSAGC